MRVQVLDNAEALTFECNSCHSLPSLDARESIKVKEVVQVVVSIEDGVYCGTEKLWVEIVEVDLPFYTGQTLDASNISPNIQSGYSLSFGPHQVFQSY